MKDDHKLDLRIRDLQKTYGMSVQQSEVYARVEAGTNPTPLAKEMGISTGALKSALAVARAKVRRRDGPGDRAN